MIKQIFRRFSAPNPFEKLVEISTKEHLSLDKFNYLWQKLMLQGIDDTLPEPKLLEILTALREIKNRHGYLNQQVYITLLRDQIEKTHTIPTAIELLGGVASMYPDDILAKNLIHNIGRDILTNEFSNLTRDNLISLLLSQTESSVINYQLMNAIEDAILLCENSTGMLNEELIVAILYTYEHFTQDLGMLYPYIAEAIVAKWDRFGHNSKARISYYMTKMEIWDDTVFSLILDYLEGVPLADVDQASQQKLYQTVSALELLSPFKLKRTLQAELLPGWLDFLGEDKSCQFAAATKTQLQKGPMRSVSFGRYEISATHQSVVFALSDLNKNFTVEYRTPDPHVLQVDILLEPNIVIEVQGPSHYIKDTYHPSGATVFKRKLIEKLGYSCIEIPYFYWQKMGKEARKMQLRSLIRKQKKKDKLNNN